jgi:hypothetical protein
MGLMLPLFNRYKMNDQDLTLSTTTQILILIPFGTKSFCSLPTRPQHWEDSAKYLPAEFLINDCTNSDDLEKSVSPDNSPMHVYSTCNGGCSHPEQCK